MNKTNLHKGIILFIISLLSCLLSGCKNSNQVVDSNQVINSNKEDIIIEDKKNMENPKIIEITQIPENTDDKNLESPLKGFPQHVSYTKGSIKPNHLSQNELDQEVIRLYDEWKEKYIKEHPYEKGQYYIWYSDGEWFKNGNADEKIATTVSEAHGYGMIIVAIMAGYDKEAKVIYDGMYQYFRKHPSSNNTDLMAWRQGDKNGKIINISGAGSATDGDMDIAYSLLLAHEQWGSDGEIDYLSEAKKVISAIMEDDVNHTEWTIKVGDWAIGSKELLTRTSDFMFHHMKVYKAATGDANWNKVIDRTYDIIHDVYNEYSINTGILPDFLLIKEGRAYPPQGVALETEKDGTMSYNACRTSWRVATDFILTGDDRALNQLEQLNQWIREATGNNPKNIGAGYALDGNVLPGQNYEDLSFSSPFMVSAMIDDSNQQWLNFLWDYNIGIPTKTGYYYGNTIRLLNAIVVSGNWWTPVLE